VGAVDVQELAHLLHLVEPAAQAAIFDGSLRGSLDEGGGHGVSPRKHAAAYCLPRGRESKAD